MEVYKKAAKRFRIFLHDLETKEARSITIIDADSVKLDELKKLLIKCIEDHKFKHS